MKLLLLFAHDYWLAPYEKSVTEAPDRTEPMAATAAVVALVHVEALDPEQHAKLVTKSINRNVNSIYILDDCISHIIIQTDLICR